MFYDIVFFLSTEAVAAGAKVSLVAGKYVITKAPSTTIQAINGGRPPVDQSAVVASLQAQVNTLTQQLAACQASKVPPTISGMTVVPDHLPVGGGAVEINAVVVGATTLTLDGKSVTLPVAVTV